MPAKFVISKARGGKFRFELLASNGRVLAQSMTHDTKRAAVSALKSVQKNATTDVVDDQSEPAKTATKTAAAKTGSRKTAAKSTAATAGRKTAARKTAGKSAAAKRTATRQAGTRKTAARKRAAAPSTAPTTS